jgi:hypothetical protein
MTNSVVPLAVPLRFAGIDVLIQTVSVPGSENAGTPDQLVDNYGKAEVAIVAIASSVAGTIGLLARHDLAPRHVSVAFGVSLLVNGDLVVVKGSDEATLAVTLTYDAPA